MSRPQGSYTSTRSTQGVNARQHLRNDARPDGCDGYGQLNTIRCRRIGDLRKATAEPSPVTTHTSHFTHTHTLDVRGHCARTPTCLTNNNARKTDGPLANSRHLLKRCYLHGSHKWNKWPERPRKDAIRYEGFTSNSHQSHRACQMKVIPETRCPKGSAPEGATENKLARGPETSLRPNSPTSHLRRCAPTCNFPDTHPPENTAQSSDEDAYAVSARVRPRGTHVIVAWTKAPCATLRPTCAAGRPLCAILVQLPEASGQGSAHMRHQDVDQPHLGAPIRGPSPGLGVPAGQAILAQSPQDATRATSSRRPMLVSDSMSALQARRCRRTKRRGACHSHATHARNNKLPTMIAWGRAKNSDAVCLPIRATATVKRMKSASSPTRTFDGYNCRSMHVCVYEYMGTHVHACICKCACGGAVSR